MSEVVLALIRADLFSFYSWNPAVSLRNGLCYTLPRSLCANTNKLLFWTFVTVHTHCLTLRNIFMAMFSALLGLCLLVLLTWQLMYGTGDRKFGFSISILSELLSFLGKTKLVSDWAKLTQKLQKFWELSATAQHSYAACLVCENLLPNMTLTNVRRWIIILFYVFWCFLSQIM